MRQCVAKTGISISPSSNKFASKSERPDESENLKSIHRFHLNPHLARKTSKCNLDNTFSANLKRLRLCSKIKSRSNSKRGKEILSLRKRRRSMIRSIKLLKKRIGSNRYRKIGIKKQRSLNQQYQNSNRDSLQSP